MQADEVAELMKDATRGVTRIDRQIQVKTQKKSGAVKTKTKKMSCFRGRDAGLLVFHFSFLQFFFFLSLLR
jgi:hypothetical protein